MQDCPFIGDLKSGFGAELTGNYYVSGIFLNDTTMQRISFSSVAENEHLVVCVWASWNEKSDEARKTRSFRILCRPQIYHSGHIYRHKS